VAKAEKKPGGFRNPSGLPSKVCPVCGRPFTWRKKWALTWEQVVYCSDRCRAGRTTGLGRVDTDGR
jgi:hypothetical protein